MSGSFSTWLFAALAVILGSLGQVFLKMGAGHDLLRSLADRHTLLGVLLYGGSFLCWLKVLAAWPLSRAYPVLALNFGLVALLSALVLGEDLGAARVLGTVLCAVGVVLVSLGS
ncbi:putative small multi-drug resistant family protein [Ammonifex degensii KC4]|uniref:Small multi-drug resistant family protein n=1 Tax=Ammonifex degensii (strain DSM 10501 / KC4) TaxID=429009 RepID=C9RCD3_AMMDK|nr:EamA family transporter [Ammonifex degensii]ACX51910.1 putative small multi-drug resistant family protein [Ammonifex degensii KC4]